jgi:hypothetical protein
MATLDVLEKQVFLLIFHFVVNWHSDLKVPCSNLIVDKQFYLQKKKHTLEAFLFCKVYHLLIQDMTVC